MLNVCPGALLACILAIPAGIALLLVSILYRNDKNEALDEPPEDLVLPVSRHEHFEIQVPCGLEEVLIDFHYLPIVLSSYIDVDL